MVNQTRLERRERRPQIVAGSDDRTVVGVSAAEDGWNLEVEDHLGTRLTYWIVDPGWVPPLGATARFYRRSDGRLCRLEMNGTRVFDACSV